MADYYQSEIYLSGIKTTAEKLFTECGIMDEQWIETEKVIDEIKRILLKYKYRPDKSIILSSDDLDSMSGELMEPITCIQPEFVDDRLDDVRRKIRQFCLEKH